MSKKNLKNDLLSQFFDHSPNYKAKRSRGYFKFLRLQKQQQLLQIYNQFYMTFIFKPYKLVLANIAIVLVILFSFTSFGFGLITQAENNPGASFTPTDSIDTTRLDDCNLDIAFPKKIEERETNLFSFQNLQKDELRNLLPGFSNLSLNNQGENKVSDISINCFENSKKSFRELVSLKYSNNGSFIPALNVKTLPNSEAKQIFKWKIFENPDVKNIQVINATGDEYIKNQEYLLFEIKNITYMLTHIITDWSNQEISKPTSSLDKLPAEFNINYNETNDFVVSKKIVYDENGVFYPSELSSYTSQIQEQNIKRMLQFFGILGVFVIIIILFCNYILNKKVKPKASLQTKIRLLLAAYGLIYLIFVNTFNAFASQVDFLYQVYNYRLDIAAMFVVAGLSFVLIVFNWKKLSKKVRFIDLAFLLVYILYVVSLVFSFSPYYSGDGTADMLGLVWLYLFPAFFTLVWVSYSAWNGYLAGKQIWLSSKIESK